MTLQDSITLNVYGATQGQVTVLIANIQEVIIVEEKNNYSIKVVLNSGRAYRIVDSLGNHTYNTLAKALVAKQELLGNIDKALTKLTIDTEDPEVRSDESVPSTKFFLDKLDKKVDSSPDKGLSTNDYTNEDKAKVDRLTLTGDQQRFLSGDGAYRKPLINWDTHVYNKPNIAQLELAIDSKIDKKALINPGTKPKISYDENGLVVGGESLTKDDIPPLPASKITSGVFREFQIPNIEIHKVVGLQEELLSLRESVEGKPRARVFATKSELDAWLLVPENVSLLKIGDNFYIEETDTPDYWWNGTTIVELETQKVDLTEYAKKSELLTLGTTENDAYRGDLGQIAYNHSQSAHAPANAQKNSDITKAEIEAKLTGEISSHSHALPNHDHDDRYYTKSETYTMAQTAARIKDSDGQTKELKSITTEPTGTFVDGDLYYNSNTKALYFYRDSAWELTGHGAPIEGVIYSFNGNLYFWNGAEADLIQIGGDIDLSNYYTTTEIDTKLAGKANTTHNHTRSEITDFPTIPDITVNNGSEESGKYISQVAVDATDKHKLVITKADLPQGFATEEAVQTKINTHNSSETSHTDIREYIEEVRGIAEGKVSALSFETKEDLDDWLLIPENVETLIVGTHFYIEDLESPDYWWNGTTIVELSTDKIDLTEYAKKSELLTLGTTENDAYRGDLGQIAYNHSQSAHAPADAQKNSDITKAEIEAKLTGVISSHSHALPTHNHDDRYYTESEVDTKLGGKANATHTHTKSEITDFPTVPTVPTISNNIAADAENTSKTTSPKAVKDYVDNAISTALGALLGGSY